MSYLGNSPDNQTFLSGTDYFSGNGSTVLFTLSRQVTSINDIIVVVENVVQYPGVAYSVIGNQLTFTGTPPSGTNNIYVRYMSVNTRSIGVSDGAITTPKIQDASVTSSKIQDGSVTSSKVAAGVALSNLGYTPVNTSGDTITGQLKIGGDAFGQPIRQLVVREDATDNTFKGIKVVNAGGSGAVSGVAFQSYDWVQGGIWHGRGAAARSGALVLGTNPDTSNLSEGGLVGRLFIDNAGRVTMPYQPAFMANLTSDWSHPSGVQKVAGTFTADVNTGSAYSTSTKRFTAPVTGNYFISASVATNGGAGTFSYLSSEIWVNGVRRIVGGWDGGGSSYGNTSVSGVVALNANDYVELYCEASKTFTMASGAGYSFISGHLIG